MIAILVTARPALLVHGDTEITRAVVPEDLEVDNALFIPSVNVDSFQLFEGTGRCFGLSDCHTLPITRADCSQIVSREAGDVAQFSFWDS